MIALSETKMIPKPVSNKNQSSSTQPLTQNAVLLRDMQRVIILHSLPSSPNHLCREFFRFQTRPLA